MRMLISIVTITTHPDSNGNVSGGHCHPPEELKAGTHRAQHHLAGIPWTL